MKDQDYKLSNSLKAIGNPVHYDDRFRDVILAHRELILARQGTTHISVTQYEADKYYGDFYGLLLSKGVSSDLLWLVTVLNGLNSSDEYNSDFLSIITPDSGYIDRLINMFNTIHI